MKIKFQLILLVLLCIACSNKTSESRVTQINEAITPSGFSAIEHKNKGVVLSHRLEIYDKFRNTIGKLDNVYRQIVEIDSMSSIKYALQDSNNRCNLHHFVKIRFENTEAWVYGQYVFEASNRDTSFAFGEHSFKWIPCKNFGVGAFDEELGELSFCGDGSENPLIIYNSFFNEYNVPMCKMNEYYHKDFVTFDDHDGWEDKIQSVQLDSNNVLKVNVLREYQEGFAALELEFQFREKSCLGTLTKASKRKAEE